MQGKAKSQRRSASLVKLQAGGGIRFGFMRQNNISGRTLSVTDVASYIFDKDSFASYQLRDEDTDINMIIAEGDRPEESYLALSFALKEKWFSALFASLLPREWFKLKPGDKVAVSDAVVMPQGWLVASYTHVLTAHGRKVDGDFRQRKVSDLAEFYSEPFDYVLLVSDDGEYAIEVEKYGNGAIKAYATVYRPMSDISETTQFRRPYIVTSNPKSEAEAKPVEATAKLTLLDKKSFEEELAAANDEATAEVKLSATESSAHAVIPETFAQPIEAPAVLKPKNPSEATIAELVESALAEAGLSKSVSVDLGKVEIIPHVAPAIETAPATVPTPENMLVVDARLVARIVEEALRNKISMADVVRKVIDMPRAFTDKVFLPFDLSAEEFNVLAKRYELVEGDTDGVKAKIVEELRQFAGLD